MSRFNVSVNARSYPVDASPDTPLLWILRDHLGFTGTKFGCGVGVCGSCTVLRDGEPVRSCQIPVSAAGPARFTTIEGLSVKGDHPVQRAWLDEDVAQCGYCQPAMILCAVALISKKPRPSDEDIDATFAETICRCGSYPRIRKAVHRAALLGAKP